jgi:hypothetical protein
MVLKGRINIPQIRLASVMQKCFASIHRVNEIRNKDTVLGNRIKLTNMASKTAYVAESMGDIPD